MSAIDSTLWIWNEHDSIACDVGAVFLLRDNVQHFLEGGTPSGRFALLHALADSFWSERVAHLDAAQLRAELFKAWDGTWQLPASTCAISLSTYAALRGAKAAPGLLGTTTARAARRVLLAAKDEQSSVGQLVSNVVGEVMALSWACASGEAIRAATPRILQRGPLFRVPRTIHN